MVAQISDSAGTADVNSATKADQFNKVIEEKNFGQSANNFIRAVPTGAGAMLGGAIVGAGNLYEATSDYISDLYYRIETHEKLSNYNDELKKNPEKILTDPLSAVFGAAENWSNGYDKAEDKGTYLGNSAGGVAFIVGSAGSGLAVRGLAKSPPVKTPAVETPAVETVIDTDSTVIDTDSKFNFDLTPTYKEILDSRIRELELDVIYYQNKFNDEKNKSSERKEMFDEIDDTLEANKDLTQEMVDNFKKISPEKYATIDDVRNILNKENTELLELHKKLLSVQNKLKDEKAIREIVFGKVSQPTETRGNTGTPKDTTETPKGNIETPKVTIETKDDLYKNYDALSLKSVPSANLNPNDLKAAQNKFLNDIESGVKEPESTNHITDLADAQNNQEYGLIGGNDEIDYIMGAVSEEGYDTLIDLFGKSGNAVAVEYLNKIKKEGKDVDIKQDEPIEESIVINTAAEPLDKKEINKKPSTDKKILIEQWVEFKTREKNIDDEGVKWVTTPVIHREGGAKEKIDKKREDLKAEKASFLNELSDTQKSHLEEYEEIITELEALDDEEWKWIGTEIIHRKDGAKEKMQKKREDLEAKIAALDWFPEK